METAPNFNLIDVPSLGLNRTMQYGNFYLNEDMDCKIYGLNRTMQYGN